MSRPDVAKAFNEPDWRECGYNFVTARQRLPSEDFQIGLLIDDGEHAEIKMTEQHLDLSAGYQAGFAARGCIVPRRR